MKNFFQLFNLEEKFEIDLEELEKKYLQFQNEFHPDKSTSKEIDQSIEINQAYQVLSDDFLRACYLLSLKGIDIQNDEKAVIIDHQTLEEALELQEKISEIEDKNQISFLEKEIYNKVNYNLKEFLKAFETNEIKLSSQLLIKVKYLKKSLLDLKNRKQKFF